MNGVIKIAKRFLPPYKNYIILNLVFNIVNALLNVFSFALIIPILQILFKATPESYDFIAWNSPDTSFLDAVKNNGYWYIGDLINTNGAGFVLLSLAIILIVMTALKTGAAFLSTYYVVPIRTGVVKDIRDNINDKILELPIAFFSEERKGDILVQSLGVNESLDVHMSRHAFFPDDVLVLASDGLYEGVSLDEMLEVLQDDDSSLDGKANKLTAAALSNYGRDNITVCIAKLKEGEVID